MDSSNNVVGSGDSSQTESKHRPDQFARRYPDARPHFCQDNLAWDLSDDIATSPGDIYHVQLILVHLKIFLHARDISIGDVGLVQILDEIAKTENQEDVEVEFLYECRFLLGATWIVVPDVCIPRYFDLVLG
jgi:hypothetical protein